MAKEITVPELGESVVEATVGDWLKRVGDVVQVGDIVVELETDKVDIEVGAMSAGTLTEIIQQAGADVRIGDVLGIIDENGQTAASTRSNPRMKATIESTTQVTADDRSHG